MSKKLKILYHHRVAAQDGQSVHITELTNSFRALGHELIFIGPSLQHKEFGKHNKWLALARKALPQFVQEILEYAYGYRAYRKLLAAYHTHKPDILYERHNLFLPAGRMLKAKTGIPYLLEVNAPLAQERSEHSGLTLQKFAAADEVKTWRAADMTFPVTNILAKHLTNSGVGEGHITVLHNGINHGDYENVTGDKIRTKYNLQGKLVLGIAGFLREWHRLDLIIELLAEIEEENRPSLLVVGESPAANDCKQQALTLGVENYVHFVGFARRDEIPEYLAAMDIALQPAVTPYASPLKLFEYMRAGLAIVAPDQDNIKEVLENGKNAVLFDAKDPAAVGKAILKLLNNQSLRENIGAAARQSIDTEGHIWLENARRISEIAATLLAEKQKTNEE